MVVGARRVVGPVAGAVAGTVDGAVAGRVEGAFAGVIVAVCDASAMANAAQIVADPLKAAGRYTKARKFARCVLLLTDKSDTKERHVSR